MLLLTALGVGSWVISVRDRKWAALLARVDELKRETASRPVERLPWGRTLTPGNAWDDYGEGATWRPGMPPPVISGKIQPVLHRSSNANRPEVDSLLTKYAASIEALSRGARRIECRPMSRLDYDVRDINALCVVRARFLAEEGKLAEALDLLFDACVHARDVAHVGLAGAAFTGHSLLLATFREFRDILQFREMTPEELLSLEHRLQVLDDHFPAPGQDVENNVLELGILMIREDRDNCEYVGINGRVRRSWRTLFSSRLHAGDTFFVADGMLRRIQEVRKLPWSEESPAIHAIGVEVQEFRDPLLRNGLHHISGGRFLRECRAVLRLLRIAARFRATGEILQLEDPFGGTLQTQQTDDLLRAWHRYLSAPQAPPPKGNGDYWWTMTIEVRRR